MQLYQGLPIITNKIPTSERKGIPHHLLGCITLSEPTWTVANFVSSALAKIAEIRSRGRLPILVGGTHYYTQSLLFNESLTQKEENDGDAADPSAATTGTLSTEELEAKWPILSAPSEEMLAKLYEVDPVMANRWHPKDHRKIRRSLEIYLQTGRPASEIYDEQRQLRNPLNLGDASKDGAERSGEGEGADAGALRTRTLVLWVHAQNNALNTRLDARIDRMLAAGLLSEVETLASYADVLTSQGEPPDQSRGIWVAIGYKEFLTYRSALQEEEGKWNSKQLETLRAAAVERTQIATRQYAKRQVRWIRIKLAQALAAAGAKNNFYLLDSTDPGQWHHRVAARGVDLVSLFVAEEAMPEPESLSALAAESLRGDGDAVNSANGGFRQHCEVCDITAVRELDWLLHVRSKKHKKLVSKKRNPGWRPGMGPLREKDDVRVGKVKQTVEGGQETKQADSEP